MAGAAIPAVDTAAAIDSRVLSGLNSRVQARFLCGPAGSGKTFRCLAEVRDALQAAAEGPPLIFIAPKQATFQLERQLLAGGNVNGYTRLHILSFERLARLVFEKLNVAPPELLGDEGRVMVLRALLLRHEDELKLFQGSARCPGFAQEVSRLLNEFQQHQLSPARLQALAGNKNLRTELRDKLRDLAFLHESYSAWLADHQLQDGNRLLDAATELLRANSGHSALKFSTLWLDGFAEMTPQELDLLAAVLPFCERATLAFCIDESSVVKEESSWLSIWNAVGNTFRKCRQRIENLPGCKAEIEMLRRDSNKSRFAQSPVLRDLEKHWETNLPLPAGEGRGEGESFEQRSGANSALRVVTCQNPEAEAVFAAREILKFVREGNRYRDCAVLVRNLEPFHKALARTFRRYEIPFFLDRRENITHHPLAELTRSALRVMAFDWRQEDWFAALKTGFCPVDKTEIDRLENESLARGWRGKKWREPIQIPENPDQEKYLEKLRQKILPPFESFYKGLAESRFQPNGKKLVELLSGLWESLRVENILESWSIDEKDQLPNSRQPAVHATVWDQMNSWLTNVELAFAGEAMSLRDWLPVLETGLANLTVGVIPPTLDEVLIGAVDRARNPELKFSLVLGVNDTVFPATPASPSILTDTDRDELNQIVSLGADLRERLARERYYGYIAFTRADERMIVSFSRTTADGSPLNHSPFIARLRTIFPKLQVENNEGQIQLDEVESANELIPRLIKIGKAANGVGGDIFKESPMISELIKSLGDLREPDPMEKLSLAVAGKLYGPVLKTSVSRLEEFAQCPFKFFVRSGLRAGERKLFELDVRERGTFQHDVLKAFHDQLVTENKRWRDLTPQEARERIEQIAAALAADFRGGLLRDSPQTKFAARAMTESLQNFIEVVVSWMRTQYQFDPTAVELSFGEKDSPLPAWEIPLDGGHELALRGRIDRVDVGLSPNGDHALVAVLDYKSSKKKLDPLLVEHGIQMQLAAYLSALVRFKDPRQIFGAEKLVPAGIFYINLRGQFENGKTRAEVLAGTDESRRSAYRHLGRFDASVLEKMDSAGAQDQFNYSRTKNGSFHKGKPDAMTREEFIAWLGRVEAQLRRIGSEIFSGAAQVDPYRKGQETPCDYCDYSAACRIDRWTHRFRVLKPASTE